MNTLLSMLLGALGLGAAAALNAQNTDDPRIGAWDELRSSTEFESLQRVFEKLDNGMIRLHLNAKLLEANQWHIDFRCDGKEYRSVTRDGKFTGTFYSCRQTGPRTVESVFRYAPPDAGVDGQWTAGRATARAQETVSADGKGYSTTLVTALANGQTREGRRDFKRRE
jgi:hypothetical protein